MNSSGRMISLAVDECSVLSNAGFRTNHYFLTSRFMFPFAIITIFFAVLTVFGGIFSMFSKVFAIICAVFAWIALIFQSVTTSLMT